MGKVISLDKQPLLKTVVKPIVVPSVNHFVANRHFVIGNQSGVVISSMCNEFRRAFVDKIESPKAKILIVGHELSRPANVTAILEDMKKRKETQVSLTTLFFCMKNCASHIKKGALFFTRDHYGVVRPVYILFNNIGWSLMTYDLDECDEVMFDPGTRVIAKRLL